MLMVIKRGDIFYADLRPVVGSEQGGIRPVIVLQNDAGNKYSPTIIVACLTSKVYELEKDSVILLEQIRTIDKSRLREKVCHLNCTFLKQVDHALKISLSLDT